VLLACPDDTKHCTVVFVHDTLETITLVLSADCVVTVAEAIVAGTLTLLELYTEALTMIFFVKSYVIIIVSFGSFVDIVLIIKITLNYTIFI
jgi:hypothetical protein